MHDLSVDDFVLGNIIVFSKVMAAKSRFAAALVAATRSVVLTDLYLPHHLISVWRLADVTDTCTP